jgi:signal transduction histidine kinase
MIKSNFLNSFQKKIDKLDLNTIKNILFNVIEENENLKTIFNSMKEGVIVIDKNSNIIFYNKMASMLLKFKITNPINLNINDVIDYQIFKEIINKAITSNEVIDDFELMIDNNKYIGVSILPLVQYGVIIGNIIIISDVTLENENKKKLRHVESLAALTTISAGIAHEIKNPLGAMYIHIQLIEDELKRKKEIVSEEFSYSIQVLKEEIERLNSIITEYLFTVRPLKPEFMLVKLKVFLDNFANFISPELESKNIKLIKNYKDLPEVWLDEKLFRQAILNLIKNSIAAISNNGIIEINAYQNNNYVYIDIIDNGEGISDENKSKIFDPYYTTKNQGTGLGLTIVYKIIREHKGDITFKSKKGETIFTIKLPISYIEKGQIEYNDERGE